MTTCLKVCAICVAFANLCVGICICTYGVFWLFKFLHKEITVGYSIVAFQIGFLLVFIGIVLLIGVIKAREKFVSLYLLVSSLLWFVVTNLVVFYLICKRPMTGDMQHSQSMITTPSPTSTTESSVILGSSVAPTPLVIPADFVPLEKSIGFSFGLVLFWCGQIGVYKYHQQIVETNMINAGESYVCSAMNEEKPLRH